jgi:hypothetical protein
MKTSLFVLLAVLLAVACRKEGLPPASTTLVLRVHVDDQDLQGDTVLYTNDAGEWYSVSRLTFYLSDFRFYRGGELVCADTGIHYIQASPGSIACFELPCVLEGAYDRATFLLGIDSTRNIHGALPNTLENQLMFWPEPMGGGYHFLKLEGHYRAKETDPLLGYALHIGTNACVIPVDLHQVYLQPEPGSGVLYLSMNLNAWFRYPEPYAFGIQGAYSMGDMAAMSHLVRNGAYTLKFGGG